MGTGSIPVPSLNDGHLGVFTMKKSSNYTRSRFHIYGLYAFVYVCYTLRNKTFIYKMCTVVSDSLRPHRL